MAWSLFGQVPNESTRCWPSADLSTKQHLDFVRPEGLLVKKPRLVLGLFVPDDEFSCLENTPGAGFRVMPILLFNNRFVNAQKTLVATHFPNPLAHPGSQIRSIGRGQLLGGRDLLIF
jgi:hypothetical protein